MAGKLPLVRGRGAAGRRLPDADAITKCMLLSSTAEAAEYLLTQAKGIFEKMMGQESVKKVIDLLKAHADNINLIKRDSGGSWAGKPISSDFNKLQHELAAEASKFMSEQAKTIKFDYAVSKDSALLRGYSSNGKPLDNEMVSAMDILFNAWLAENNMISKGGVIYEGTKNGQMKQDEQGQPIRANAKMLREKISSNDGGFEQYVHKNNKSVELMIQQQPYPEQQVAPEEVAPSTSTGGGH